MKTQVNSKPMIVDGQVVLPSPLPEGKRWYGPLRAYMVPQEDCSNYPRRGGVELGGGFYLVHYGTEIKNHRGTTRFHYGPDGFYFEVTAHSIGYLPFVAADAGKTGFKMPPYWGLPGADMQIIEAFYALGCLLGGKPIDIAALDSALQLGAYSRFWDRVEHELRFASLCPQPKFSRAPGLSAARNAMLDTLEGVFQAQLQITWESIIKAREIINAQEEG